MRPATDVRSDPRARERGAVLVELALVGPLLVLLLITFLDLGLVLREYQVLQNAAREGARLSVHPPSWVDWRNPGASYAAIQQRVVDYLRQERIPVDAASVTVTQTHPVVVNGLTVYTSQVTVSYDRRLLVPGLGVLPSPTVTLTANAVFRNLY
jgi:Flp pilus assembly protein TadG